MVPAEHRTWLVTLTTFLICLGSSQCDLLLTVDRNVSNEFCGSLHCWNEGNLDNTISSISTLSVYDITQPEVSVLLASVPKDGLGIKINQLLISSITAFGSIDDFNASISINFKSPQDCDFGSFLCELEYVDVNGQRDMMTVEDRPSSDYQCTCGAINFQLASLAGQVENNTELVTSLRQDVADLSKELSDLRQQNSHLLIEFQKWSSQVAQLQDNSTSVQTFPSTTATTTTSTVAALGSECSRGMPHSSPRAKFLLWGRIPALCDTETDGGGWVIIQRRAKGDVDFYRDWESYKTGFGKPDTDFWLGNDVIHNLTSQGYNKLRVDMIFKMTPYYAHYNFFSVDNEQQNYRLTVSGYRGTAGDGLSYHTNTKFSTYDRDNDKSSSRHCAFEVRGAWWHNACYYSNLNGGWGVNNKTGIIWARLAYITSLDFTEIKVRLGDN